MDRGIVRGLAVFRWVAWVWMTVVVVVSRDKLVRPWLAIVLVAAAFAVTVLTTPTRRRPTDRILTPRLVAVELVLAFALSLGGGWAYESGTALSTTLALGSPWVIASIVAAGVIAGPWIGAGAGLALGLARVGAVYANDVPSIDGGQWLSLASTIVVFVLPGALAGSAVRLARRVEHEVAAARARDEVARTLHDGVLQTLAVIERRSDDPMLRRMARDQELELREFLFGSDELAASGGAAELGPALRAHAARFEAAFDGRVEVLLAPDLPHVGPAEVDALAGAVGEALVNAGKHGAAPRVVVYVEPFDGGGLSCSVHDDGRGFDADSGTEGVGITRSIRGRIEEIGGTVEIESRIGSGTEVRMWLR